MKQILKILIFTFLLFCFSGVLYSQNLRIEISDVKKNPLPGATVQLVNFNDSTKKYTTTDFNGIALFENVKNGLYSVSISYVGFLTFERDLNIKSDNRKFEFSLLQNSIALEGVEIVAKKPLIRYEDDKMIVDPEPLASISSNTLEVLESTPGIFVDQDGGVFISGAAPAAVYINGRQQKMSNQDLNNLLRSIPPNSVEKIEIIRTPSAKYDAASSGGIVNIVLKKGVRLGRFGSVNTSANQGKMGNRSLGFSLNNSSTRSTTYLNANFNHNTSLEELDSERILTTDSSLFQYADNKTKSNNVFLGYGYNLDVSERHVFNYDGRIYFNQRNADSENFNYIKHFNENVFSSKSVNDNSSNFFSIQQDLGYKIKIDTMGSELDNKFSITYNDGISDLNLENSYLFPVNFLINTKTENKQNRVFALLQSDLKYMLPHKITFETGFKSTYQNFNSNSNYFRVDNGTAQPINSLNNSFTYKEQINSLYIQGTRTFFNSFNLKLGLRLENTNMQGTQVIPKDTSFSVNRTDLFPYVFISRNIANIANMDVKGFLILRRTILRPSYQNLNPYINYVDEFLQETGNPALKPQFTDNIEANVSVNDFPIFALGRNYTSNIFTNVIYTDETNPKILIRTFDNLGSNKETYFRLMAGIPPGNRYFFALGTQYSYMKYDGYYDGSEFNFERGSWRFFTFHSLNIAKETKLTLSGFMMYNGLFHFYELDTFGQLNFGINQTFFNKKLHVTLNIRDIFKTSKTNFALNQYSMVTTGSRITDSRRIGINIRYNFGMKKNEDKQNMMKFDIEE